MKASSFIGGLVLGLVLGAVAVVSAQSVRGDSSERNKAIAVEFYDRGLNQLDFERAAELMGDRYIQHNPRAIDGPEGFKNHIEFLKREFPQNRGEIKRVLADGDLVALHVHSRRTPDSLGNAVVDIFRIENGKVVEHWDVVQAVLPPEEALNDNTMF